MKTELSLGKVPRLVTFLKPELTASMALVVYIIFRAIDGITNADFIYYLICSDIVREPAIKSMVGTSGRQRVQKDVVANLKIDLPSYDEQSKIAAILKSLDDKIELNNQINKNLEQQAQAIFKNYFVENFNSDWKEIYLSEIANFIGGYSYKGNELKISDTAMVTIKNFNRNGGFKLDGLKEIQPSAKLKIEHDINLFDVVVAHTDLTQNAEIIGNAENILSFGGYKKIIFSMDVVKVVPKNDKVSKFLLGEILRTKEFKNHCLGYVNGTTVLHLSKKALPEYKLFFPTDFSVLNEIDKIIFAVYEKISTNIEENLRLAEMRDLLLPKLLSGEIDVSKVEI